MLKVLFLFAFSTAAAYLYQVFMGRPIDLGSYILGSAIITLLVIYFEVTSQ